MDDYTDEWDKDNAGAKAQDVTNAAAKAAQQDGDNSYQDAFASATADEAPKVDATQDDESVVTTTADVPAAPTAAAPVEAAVKAADAKPMSFREKFAAERTAGAKIFEWQGKKYTTELAKPKGSAASAVHAPVTASASSAAPAFKSDAAQMMRDTRSADKNITGVRDSAPAAEARQVTKIDPADLKGGHLLMGADHSPVVTARRGQ